MLVIGGSDEIDGEVSDNCHVVGAVSCSQTGLIVPEGDVQHPVQTVLDRPMAANGLSGAGR
jgi:hypothetical protein